MKLIIDKISHGDEALAWRQPVDVALDHHGPVDVAYDPLPPDFLHRPLFALFESVVARNPTALALADETSRVSYGALHAKAVTLARQIIATVPAGRAVAMLLPQSADAVAAVLACLAASRVVLLLNAEHPDERNATILQDSGVAAVILSSAAPIPSWLPNDVLHIVVPPASDDTIEAIQLPSVLATPDEPAVVLYTSGSTGRPKGIVQ